MKAKGTTEQNSIDGENQLLTTDQITQVLDDVLSGHMPSEIDESQMATIKIAIERHMMSGPIPPPDILKGYEEIVLGAAKQIMDNMTQESEHRRTMERKAIDYAARDSQTGMWQGFSIAILGLLLGFAIILVAIMKGEGILTVLVGTVSGTVLGGSSIVALVRQFTGKNKAEAEQSEYPQADVDD